MITFPSVIDWKIYDVPTGGDSYIYVVANNKPTIAQLKEVSETFRYFTEDVRITRETCFPYSTGNYTEEEEEEGNVSNIRNKLKKIDSNKFESLDSF